MEIGVGFPALLEVARSKGARVQRYDPEDQPSVGDTITARVVAFNGTNRQVGLSLLNPDPYRDSSK